MIAVSTMVNHVRSVLIWTCTTEKLLDVEWTRSGSNNPASLPRFKALDDKCDRIDKLKQVGNVWGNGGKANVRGCLYVDQCFDNMCNRDDMATTFSWLKVRPLQNKVRFSSSLKVTCQILLGALFLIWIENWFTVECYKFRVKPPSAAASTGLIGALDCRSTKLWFDDGQRCEPARPACWLGIFWLESFRGLTCIVLASHTLLSARQLCLQLCGSFDEFEDWPENRTQTYPAIQNASRTTNSPYWRGSEIWFACTSLRLLTFR